MPQGVQYQILKNKTLEEIEKDTQNAMAQGWQPAGPVTAYAEGFFHEMVLITQSPMEAAENQRKEQARVLAQTFAEKYKNLDAKTKTLLDINNISVFVENGQMFTRIGDKISIGISPAEVLSALKASKHCPMDLDEDKFLNDIGGLL